MSFLVISIYRNFQCTGNFRYPEIALHNVYTHYIALYNVNNSKHAVGEQNKLNSDEADL